MAANALVAAAVLGDRFDFDLLCQVAGLDEVTGLGVLDELLARGLVKEGQAGYLFAHDKIREVVYAGAGEAHRRTFHRRTLAALKGLNGPPASLVHHALCAGLLEDAFHFSVAAGDGAMAIFAMQDAIRYFEQALQWASEALRNHLDTATFGHLFLQLGRAYEYSNNLHRAGEIYREMLDWARSHRADRMACGALMRIAYIAANDTFQLDTAQRFL